MESLNLNRHSPTTHPHRQVCAPMDSDTAPCVAGSAVDVLSASYRNPLVPLRFQPASPSNLSRHLWKQRTQTLCPRNRNRTVQGISPDTSHITLKYCVPQSVCVASPDACPSTSEGNMSMSVGSSVDNRGTAPPLIAFASRVRTNGSVIVSSTCAIGISNPSEMTLL